MTREALERLAMKLLKGMLVIFLGFLTVIVVRAARNGRDAHVLPLPVHGEVGTFALTERNGRDVAGAELRGRIWIADFIFTRCQSTCPRMTAEMAQLASGFADNPEIEFVSFTVDPEHDSPAVLAHYAETHGADRERWLFLTGSQEAIYKLARTSFHLGVEEVAGAAAPADEEQKEQKGGTVEPFIHTTRFALVDRQGKIRGYYDSQDAARIRQLRADVRALLREQPPRPPS